MRSVSLVFAFALVFFGEVFGKDATGCWEMSVVSKRPYEGGQIFDFTDGKKKKIEKDKKNKKRDERNDSNDDDNNRSNHEKKPRDTSKIILTYHHVIPKSLLAKFYNRALCEQPEKLGGLFKVIKASLFTYAFREKSKMGSDFENAIKLWEKPTDMNQFLDPSDNSPNAKSLRIAQQELARALQWAPGLLVKGPAPDLRTDDPSSNMEEKVCWMTGCADERVGGAQCTLLNAAHTAINDYLNSKGKSLHALDKALGHLRSIYGKPGDGAEFEPDFWEFDKEIGKFSANDKARRLYKNHIPMDAEEQIANKGRIENGMTAGACGASNNGQNQKAEIESLPFDYMMPRPYVEGRNGKKMDEKQFREFVMGMSDNDWQWFLDNHAEEFWGDFISSDADESMYEEEEDEGWEVEVWFEDEEDEWEEEEERWNGNLRKRTHTHARTHPKKDNDKREKKQKKKMMYQ
eukprot:GDKI01031779.1.p1 GENE.GDKI01031779.1~~GDKI01031779.1.p1  ORF type:complete len:461 (-),score=146.12 GDKI01031779.1:19-1401(-)